MIARKHHYIPKCYLKAFSKPRKRGKFRACHVYDRCGKHFRTNIDNIGCSRDFNRIDSEKYPPDILERYFSKFETEIEPIIQRVINKRSIEDENDKIFVLNLIAALATRTPKTRETVRKTHERILRLMVDLATSTKEKWDRQIKSLREENVISDNNVSYTRFREFISGDGFRIDVEVERYIEIEIGVFDVVLQSLIDRKWTLFVSGSDSKGFITSDNPVCLYYVNSAQNDAVFPPGYDMQNTEIAFPLGKELALVGSFENDSTKIFASEFDVARLNGIVVSFSNKQVYSPDADFGYILSPGGKIRDGRRLVSDEAFLS